MVGLCRAVHVWKAGYEHSGTNNPSCGVWFYLFTTIATILGCILWCAVAKWYKKRELFVDMYLGLFFQKLLSFCKAHYMQ